MKTEYTFEELYGKAMFCIRYADYPENTFTVPVLFTKERADKFCEDASVVEVKMNLIDSNVSWILKVK